ncbi:MAG: peptidoglycan-binding protein [Clostridiaceae bacterium]|jgi:peptidoglycan hydrolase-like protein with peptidoglycan-binding domain|nr:peptidoglycan-binding protein [Butyricicoccus pullicaecorum]MBS7225587.1 peptidoglycan-binding protein [Clostridiaceae bacterium]
MYTQEQRRAHVRGLQQDLRVVQAALGEPLPKVSGVYDDATEHAVQRFQRHFGLPVTGKADLSTWDRIVQEANLVRSRTAIPLAVRVFPSALQIVAPGDHGRFLYILQAMLNGLSAQYPALLPIPYTGIYDDATERAIRQLQQSCGLPVTGRLNADTWNTLAHLYSHIGLRSEDFLD